MRIFFFSVLMLFLSLSNVSAQTDMYTTTSGEMIFQDALVTKDGQSLETNTRFTIFFHLGEYVHYNLSPHFGLFSGVAVRNIGFITQNELITEANGSQTTYDKVKRRTYTLGVPLALKLGSMSKDFFFFGGGEMEYAFVYKEKRFLDDDKTVSKDWFSNKVNPFLGSVFVGVQMPYGLNCKFKYYLTDFLNSSTSYNAGFSETQLFYISFSYQLRNKKKDKSQTVDPESNRINM